mgnify:CR=1 FL=1
MAIPGYIQKTIRLKPEVEKIFNDLDAWLDYCRFNLLPYNPADLYKSPAYKQFAWKNGDRKPYRGYRSDNYRGNRDNNYRNNRNDNKGQR